MRGGYIRVNERRQTSAPGIWAMGECAGSHHFPDVATDDFRIVRDNLNGGNRSTRGRLVPFCIFTDPELARVGLERIGGAETVGSLPPGEDSHGQNMPHGYDLRNARFSKGSYLVRKMMRSWDSLAWVQKPER